MVARLIISDESRHTSVARGLAQNEHKWRIDGGRVVVGNLPPEVNFMGCLAENSVPGDFQRHIRSKLPLMKPRFRIASSQVLFGTLLPFFIGQANAAEYTWSNLTANGSLGSGGYTLGTASNWVGNASPSFNNTATLNLLNSPANITLNAGVETVIVNRINSSGSFWRINSGASTLSFQGSDPTLDVRGGTLRLEVMINSTVGITKTGAGTLFSNLQSVSSGFTGPFTIAQGTVNAGNNWALGDQKSVNILSGGTLNLNSQNLGAEGITGSGSVTRNYSYSIAGTGASGGGALVNSGSDVTESLSGIKNLTLTGDASIGGSGRYDIARNSGAIAGGGYTLTKTGTNAIWMRGAASNIHYSVDQGSLITTHGSALGDSVLVKSGATLGSGVSGGITSTPLTLQGGSTLANTIIGGNWTWAGPVSLESGTVTMNASYGTLIVNGVISGTGNIEKTGGTHLTLGNQNSYSGTTTISAGRVYLYQAGTFGSGNVVNNASLYFSRTDAHTVSNLISGTGTVVHEAAGTTTLTAANSYSGLTTISAGRIKIGDGGSTGSIGSGSVSLTGTGGLIFDRDNDFSFGNTIYGTGSGGLVKQGEGTVTLTGNNTYTGNTLVSEGELIVNGRAGSHGVLRTLTVSSGASLGGSGTLGQDATISGIHSPGNSPGIQTFERSLTYTAGSSIVWELIDNSIAARGTNYDGINVGGNLAFNGATTVVLDFNLLGSGVDWSDDFWKENHAGADGWLLFDVAGTTTGLTSSNPQSLVTLSGGTRNYVDSNGQRLSDFTEYNGGFYIMSVGSDVYLSYVVPEPSAALLGGLGALLLLRRRRA